MPRRKFTSPVLELEITPELHESAVKSASGGCLIADAVKKQYPNLTRVTVDMATIRATDRKEGVRYTYLTPPLAQHLLLAFDQGWPQPADEVVIKRAVQIVPIIRPKTGPRSAEGVAERRAQRVKEFEERIANGEKLTRSEKKALWGLRNPRQVAKRPTSRGKAEVSADRSRVVVRGGQPRVQGPAHPNLLRGRNRHFGAQMADPGVAFREAVDAAVADRLAEKDAAAAG